MSVVTGVMLIVGFGDDLDGEAVVQVQDWLAAHRQGQQLKDVSDQAGGWKHPQFRALAAGINTFLEEDEFANFVISRPWRHPENVVLILQPEEGVTRIFRPVKV